MPAIATPHPGKPQVQISAVQIPIDHVSDIGPEKTVSTLIEIFPDHFQVFEMVLHALKVRSLMRIARFIEVVIFSLIAL